MHKINNWVERRKREQEQADIESTINGTLKAIKGLPYQKQVELLEMVKKSLEKQKTALEAESNEITKCLIKINEL